MYLQAVVFIVFFLQAFSGCGGRSWREAAGTFLSVCFSHNTSNGSATRAFFCLFPPLLAGGGCLFSFPAAGALCRFLPCCLLPFMAHTQWAAGKIPESVPGEPAFSCRIAGDGVSRLFQAILKSWMRTCGS